MKRDTQFAAIKYAALFMTKLNAGKMWKNMEKKGNNSINDSSPELMHRMVRCVNGKRITENVSGTCHGHMRLCEKGRKTNKFKWSNKFVGGDDLERREDIHRCAWCRNCAGCSNECSGSGLQNIFATKDPREKRSQGILNRVRNLAAVKIRQSKYAKLKELRGEETQFWRNVACGDAWKKS